jgi:hypothetical protein
MCDLVKWMVEEGKVRQVFEVQKGGCEDASEDSLFFLYLFSILTGTCGMFN